MGTIRLAGIVLTAGSLFASAASAEPAQRGRGGAAPTCTTTACDVQGDWERTKNLLIGLVNAMPDDKFTFKPTPAQQTFAQRVLHVSQTDLFILKTLGGKTPAPTINEKATTKAALLADLKQTFDYGEAVIKEFTDQQWVQRVPPPGFMGSSASRVRIVYFDMQHSEDMYGQFVVYVRLNGVTPPASAPRRGGPPEP